MLNSSFWLVCETKALQHGRSRPLDSVAASNHLSLASENETQCPAYTRSGLAYLEPGLVYGLGYGLKMRPHLFFALSETSNFSFLELVVTTCQV